MSYYPNHNMPPCGRPPQHPLTFGELNYTAEQINALLGMIPFKADRAEVPEMEKLSDVNYVGHVSDPSLLTHQAQPSWAMVGDLRACRPYFYYVEGFVPQGYQPGWNDVSHVLGTYNLTENKVSIFDFSLVTEYNVSHNHTHLAKVFNQEWAAIPYRSYEKQFIAAKKYKKGDCVNMPEYTLYTFRATTDMQNIPPFVEQETNAFTFDEAIAVTPADYRIPGIKLTFINRMDGKAYTYFFRGKSADLWTDVQSWQIIDYAANDEVYRTNLFDRFISHEEIDGAEVTEADLKEVTAIIQAIQADKVVSFYYDPDKSSVTHFGTLDCYINETLSEFGCYISTVDGYFIARCNVRKPGKWSMIGLSSGGGGGTSPVSYNQLTERPSINNVLLTGSHTENELGIPSFNDLEQVNRTAETAKNAVATLEGLSNATTAMETLAGQVVQIEENKQNIVANKAEADAKLSELASRLGTYTENPEYMRVYTDAEGRFLWGIKKDGSIEFAKGVPTPIKQFIAEYVDNATYPVKEEIKEFREQYMQEYDSLEWARVVLDSEGRIVYGIKKDGDIVYGAGIPSMLKKYVEYTIKSLDKPVTLEDVKKAEYHNALFLQNQPTFIGLTEGYGKSPLCLLHFSDVHSNSGNLKRVIDFKHEYSAYIDDVISTGDQLNGSVTDAFEFWTECGADSVLITNGNHDAASNGYGMTNGAYPSENKSVLYNKQYAPFMAQHIANGLVFGNGDYIMYYYKDYTDKGVRLISLDAPYFDNTQITWLRSVLEDARVKELQVVIMNHFPLEKLTTIDCGFDSLIPHVWSPSGKYLDYKYLNQVEDEVNSFINNGGRFVCHLVGHTHFSVFAQSERYPNQLCVAVPSASSTASVTRWGDIPRVSSEQDCFNMVSVDTHNRRLSIYRIGADRDIHLRKQKSISYDYINMKILYCE